MFEHSPIHCSSKKIHSNKVRRKKRKNRNLSSAKQNYEYEKEQKKKGKHEITVKYIQF